MMNKLILDIDYDDGFIMWINGHELVRQNMGKPGSPVSVNQSAEFSHQVTFNNYDPNYHKVSYIFDKSLYLPYLVVGKNVISLQIHCDTCRNSMYYESGFQTPVLNDSWDYRCKVSMDSSYLPIVKILNNGDEIQDTVKSDAQMFIYNDDSGRMITPADRLMVFKGNIGTETRGASSQYWYPKKSYSVETRDLSGRDSSVTLLGMPSESDWILYGPFDDKSEIKNVFAYSLGRKLGYYEPRTRFCEVILNDDYLGIYVLTEKIKRDPARVNVSGLTKSDLTGDQLTGGYIFKFDKSVGENTGGWDSPVAVAGRHSHFEYHYPKADEITSEQQDYIQRLLEDFEHVLVSKSFADPTYGYKKFINVNSFVDFVLLIELSNNLDAYQHSTYFYKDRDLVDPRLVAGPLWDFNLAFGYDDNDAGFEDWVFLREGKPFWWRRMMEDPDFTSLLKDRWVSLRQNLFSENSLHALVDSCVAELRGMQMHNFEVWPMFTVSPLWPRPWLMSQQTRTYSEEIQFFKNWLSNRINWMDKNIPYLNFPVDSYKWLTDVDVNRSSTSMKIFPNPFQSSINLEGTIPLNGHISFELVDVTGKTVFKSDLGYYQAGNSLKKEFHINHEISKGIYFYKLSNGRQMFCAGKAVKSE